MNHTPSASISFALSRRALVKSLAFAGAAFATFPHALHAALAAGDDAAAQIGSPVVSYYMDRLYLDSTGTALPYLAPSGMRSAAPLAHVTEEAFRRAQLYV